MYVSPDAGKSIEQICEEVWARLAPSMQARVDACAIALGVTRLDLMLDMTDRYLTQLETDEAYFQSVAEGWARQDQPLGPDPRRAERGTGL